MMRLAFRSGLEERIAQQLREYGLEVIYETDRIPYTIPARDTRYTPDFKLPKAGGFFYVETKGIWSVGDRTKHLLIKQQHPEIDIRFVFSRSTQKLYKGSPTSYGDYCQKHGFKFAQKLIPEEWLEEAKVNIK